MAAPIDKRLQRVLIELAESKELTPRERLEAARQLAEIKANKPARRPAHPKKPSSVLG